jgi:DNA-binding FrmR family transcriptional regulator
MAAAKKDVLDRVASIAGYLREIRNMVEGGQYCVHVFKQAYAVERVIHKLEAVPIEGHLQGCALRGFEAGRSFEAGWSDAIIRELTELYTQARR